MLHDTFRDETIIFCHDSATTTDASFYFPYLRFHLVF